MNYTVKGFITDISDVTTLENGAKKLEYLVKTDNEYDNAPWKIEMYKSEQYAEHVDNFVKFNQVGDRVEVEFNIRPAEWQGKHFINLTHWKCTKLTDEENALHNEVDSSSFVDESEDGLPF